MKTHKFNRDIEYWYDRSVRVWYCQFTPEAESEIENLDPYYFVPVRETRSGLTKSDILEACEDLNRDLESRRLKGNLTPD
tara:strand:- start:8883 stop:9122 length:240 start_codon:yes stop_codon:yes gene_type:complete